MRHKWTVENCGSIHKCDECKHGYNDDANATHCFYCGEWADNNPEKRIERNCYWEPKDEPAEDKETE